MVTLSHWPHILYRLPITPSLHDFDHCAFALFDVCRLLTKCNPGQNEPLPAKGFFPDLEIMHICLHPTYTKRACSFPITEHKCSSWSYFSPHERSIFQMTCSQTGAPQGAAASSGADILASHPDALLLCVPDLLQSPEGTPQGPRTNSRGPSHC